MPWAFERRKMCCLKTLVVSQFNQLHCSWELKNLQVPTSAALSRNWRQEEKKKKKKNIARRSRLHHFSINEVIMSGPSMETRNRWTHSMHAIHLFQLPRVSSAPMTLISTTTHKKMTCTVHEFCSYCWFKLTRPFLRLKFCNILFLPL